MNKNLAAIDIGTNSFHLAVVRYDTKHNKYRILDREKEIVRLGYGSADMKYLSYDAVSRGIRALRCFKQIADAHNAGVRAVGTSAVREALNKNEFISRVREETGIDVEVVSGFEEARLIYLGALQALPIMDKRVLLVDIGGGSTEFLIGEQKEVIYSNSLKLGAIRLTQRFFKTGKACQKAVKKCRRYITGVLEPVIRDIRKQGFEIAVGSSGTISNIAQIANALEGKPASTKLNGAVLTEKSVEKTVQRILKARTTAKIAGIRGLDPKRADIITAGALILEQVFKHSGTGRMTVSDYALREGIFLDTIEKLHAARTRDYLNNARLNSVMHLARSFNYDEEHAGQVAGLALSIFDLTDKLHKLGAVEKELLEYGALLHDIGMSLSHSQHHMHSYYLIRNSELMGFTENEKEIIANLARYHRKSHPKLIHEGYGNLSDKEKTIVRKLAAILRIADGLDRSHSKMVERVKCRISRKKVVFNIKPMRKKRAELELWGADRKKQLFEEEFLRKAVFRVI